MDNALQINGPVGTGDYVIYENTEITENHARGYGTQLNHPTSDHTLAMVKESRFGMNKKKYIGGGWGTALAHLTDLKV